MKQPPFTYGELQERSWLRDALRRTDSEDTPMFYQIIIESMRILGMEPLEMSELVDTSVPTIRKWASYRNAPLPPMRKGIYEVIMEKGQP